MADKVIHVSQETHSQLKEYCQKSGVALKDWAEQILLDAILVPVEKRKLLPVEKKKPLRSSTEEVELVENPEDQKEQPQPANDPWSRQPFWKQKAVEENNGGDQRAPGSRTTRPFGSAA